MARTSNNPLSTGRSGPTPTVFRGTPLFIQLLLIYYGSGQFESIQQSWAWPMLEQAWFCAMLTFVLNTAAYTTEIIHGAILATPHGRDRGRQGLPACRPG